jgi:hypothetical protein
MAKGTIVVVSFKILAAANNLAQLSFRDDPLYTLHRVTPICVYDLLLDPPPHYRLPRLLHGLIQQFQELILVYFRALSLLSLL